MKATIMVDPSYDLHEGGKLNTEASQDNFFRAYARAARRLGFFAVRGRYNGPDDESDAAGMDEETLAQLWQAAHDAIHESRPGRWHVAVSAGNLREIGRDIVGGQR